MEQLQSKFPNQCLFVESGVRCEEADDGLSPFCSGHKDYFSGLSNQELLEAAARCSREVVSLTSGRKIATSHDPEVVGRLGNHLVELRARGYTLEEIQSALASVAEALKIYEDFDKELGGLDPKWKKFEKLVAGIHKMKEQGAEVIFDDKIIGKRTGEERQVDVSVRFRHGYYEYLIIIECKDYRKKVSVDKVEALRTKMEDLGADKGVMVSTNGFQKGAVKAAAAHNIELFTLTEEVSDWTKVIREEVIKFPFPTVVKFEHPVPGGHHERGHTIYDEVLLYRDENGPPITLEQIVVNVGAQVHARGEELPCEIYAPFDPPLLTEFPVDKSMVRVSGVAITFESYERKLTREIDMPPRTEKYIYSDVEQKHRYEIPAYAEPIGEDTVLEAGKFYSDSIGRMYKCLEVEDENVTMVFLDSLREVVRYRYEFVVSAAAYSRYYVPLTDSGEVERLEKIFRSLEGNQNR
jgi:hypothetical protein